MTRADWLLASALLVGCGSQLRTVPTGPHPSNGGERIIVDFPPPPAQPERIESDPGKPCMWQDGHWAWQGRRWSWQPGGWVVPPAGCYYADAVMVWVPSLDEGELYYLPPRWYPNDAEQMTPAQVLASCKDVRACGRAGAAPDETQPAP